MSSLGDTKNHFSGKTVNLEIFCCCSAAFSLQLDYVYVFCPLKTLCLTRHKKYGVKKHFQEEMYFFVTASLIFHYLIKVEFCTILQNSKTLMILATIYSMHLHFYVIYKLVLWNYFIDHVIFQWLKKLQCFWVFSSAKCYSLFPISYSYIWYDIYKLPSNSICHGINCEMNNFHKN